MGSNLSCTKKNAGDSPAENVYSEPDESDVKGDSRASIGPADHQQVSSSSDQSAKQFHTNNSNSNANNNNNHHHQKTTEKHAVRVKALLPPDVKPTANAKTKSDATNTAILHDENGYAMPFIKSSNAAALSGKTQNSPPKSKGKLAGKADDKSSAARNVGVKTIVLPAKSREKSQPETGAYCNVVLKDRESKSFSNEIYEDSDMQVPKVPKNTRATLKMLGSPEQSKGGELNYIEVEFVNSEEVTSRAPRVQRSSSPTQYTDVISKNGVIHIQG